MEGQPVAEWSGSTRADAPVVVLLHGWGETEADMTAFVPRLPHGFAYASVRAPHARGRSFAWFARGEPFDRTLAWFEEWLDGAVVADRPVVLVGFSAGAAFAGGAILVHPDRYVGAAILCGTLPFDAGVATPPGRLAGKHVFVGHSRDDPQMPHDLLDRAWDYLTRESGAITEAHRYDCGHEVTAEALADLHTWLGALTVP